MSKELAPFAKRFNAEEQLSVIAAAVSRRWGIHTIAEAFGLNWRTVEEMRSGRSGRYRRAGFIIEQLGESNFVRDYLMQDTIDRIESVANMPTALREARKR